MPTFENREKAFEEKFAHDAELRFKAEARRDKLLGLWAAELMGLEGDAAEDYARSVIKADLEEPGDDDVFRKLQKDLGDKQAGVSDQDLRAKMNELLAVAVEQIESAG